jgi:hypothetical protein
LPELGRAPGSPFSFGFLIDNIGQCAHFGDTMIRIEITAAAYEAIAAGVPEQSRLEALRSPSGGFYLWLDKITLNKLKAARGPGESYSDAILRFACEAA